MVTGMNSYTTMVGCIQWKRMKYRCVSCMLYITRPWPNSQHKVNPDWLELYVCMFTHVWIIYLFKQTCVYRFISVSFKPCIFGGGWYRLRLLGRNPPPPSSSNRYTGECRSRHTPLRILKPWNFFYPTLDFEETGHLDWYVLAICTDPLLEVGGID